MLQSIDYLSSGLLVPVCLPLVFCLCRMACPYCPSSSASDGANLQLTITRLRMGRGVAPERYSHTGPIAAFPKLPQKQSCIVRQACTTLIVKCWSHYSCPGTSDERIVSACSFWQLHT